MIDLEAEFDSEEEEGELVHEGAKRRKRTNAGATGNEPERPKHCPPHPGYIWGVCLRCGAKKPEEMKDARGVAAEKPVGGVALRYIPGGMELNQVEADRIRAGDMQRLMADKKLLLILDLDHTVLNSTKIVDLGEEAAHKLEAQLAQQQQQQQQGGAEAAAAAAQQQLFHLPHIGMWTKVRPFTADFLREASELFEMYIYTMGESGYAAEMASILDPTGRLFEGRVISKTDSTTRHTKDLDVVLGADSTVVILDDTEGVWPKHLKNVVKVERYHYFPSSVKAFHLKHRSLLDSNVDESRDGGLLSALLRVLKEVHTRFFEAHGDDEGEEGEVVTDVRGVLQDLRSEVLRGCSLVFSRVFPSADPNPHLHPLWRLAELLGATCSTSMGPGTTHLVATDRNTEKARQAAREGRHVVTPRWLDACSFFWRREDEAHYRVPAGGSGKDKPSKPVRNSPGHTFCPPFPPAGAARARSFSSIWRDFLDWGRLLTGGTPGDGGNIPVVLFSHLSLFHTQQEGGGVQDDVALALAAAGRV